jgi:hypothetical protein
VGGNYPMPTLISKGPILVRLDAHYMDAADRLASLKRLRDQGLDVVASGKQGKNKTGSDLLSQADADHILSDWFDVHDQWWNALKPHATLPNTWENTTLTADDLKAGKAIVRTALVYALEKSLGLAPGQVAPLTVAAPSAGSLKPVKVSWVCGKADGFEAQVIWSENEIHLYILTPPIHQALQPLAAFTEAQAANHDAAQTGMALVTGKVVGGQPITSIVHIARGDGGIASGGMPLARPELILGTARVKAMFSTDVDDPGKLLGNTEPEHEDGIAKALLVALESWFGDPEHPEREIHRLSDSLVRLTHVTVGNEMLWAQATITGNHLPMEGGDHNFLGWSPTGLPVELKAVVQARHRDKSVDIDDVIWDRQSVHGQLGVKAIGRPVLR